jgi:hypothetical protein
LSFVALAYYAGEEGERLGATPTPPP